MTGTLVNTAAVLVGAGLGCCLKKGIANKYKNVFFQVVGLFSIVLGVKMAFDGMAKAAAADSSADMFFPLFVLFSLVLGGLLGEWAGIERHIGNLGVILKNRFKLKNERFSEGFMSGFLLFCMGSMAVVGAINEGLGEPSGTELLLTKSIMDLFSSMMLASALGVGVLFSALGVLIFQGGITLAVSLFSSAIPDLYIASITAVGGLILLALGFTLTKARKMRVSNLLPSLIIICLFIWIKMQFFS